MTLKSLPPDIILDILSRLPPESVLDCKLVCKSLLTLLTNRRNHFARIHHHRQLLQLANGDSGDDVAASCLVKMGLIFSFAMSEEKDRVGPRLYYGDEYNDEMNIHGNFSYKTLRQTRLGYPRVSYPHNVLVGSSNGLICLNRIHNGIPDPIHICNPMSGEYVNLPKHTLPPKKYIGAFGFGYVHSTTNVYKVVRIYYEKFENFGEGEVQVYTIGGGNGWRTIGTTSYELYLPQPVGIFANGALHWVEYENIVAFSLADEEFRLVQPVPCLNPLQEFSVYGLQALGGNLCLYQQRYSEHLLDIWLLKGTGPQECWSMDFRIDMANLFPYVPLLLTKKNEVLLVHNYSTLYCYDPETATSVKLWDDGSKGNVMYLSAFPHMNSFLSLKSLGEQSKKKKRVKNDVLTV